MSDKGVFGVEDRRGLCVYLAARGEEVEADEREEALGGRG